VYTLKKEKGGYLVEKTYIVEKMTYSNETFIADGLLEGALIVDKGARLIKANETVILAE
jgi:antitoxin component YwqK of YwqJK toxin-antitoxin module